MLANSRSKLFDPLLTKEDIFSQILWRNRLIKVGNECLFSRSMIDSNIIFVKDILNMNGTIKTNIFNELTIDVNYFSDPYRIKKLYTNINPFI